MTNIYPYNNIWPKLDQSVFVAPDAFISGDVEMGKGSSVWPFCSLRGDEKEIRIGEYTNIQDNTVVHVTGTLQGTYIGDHVTIGHGCIIHACTIGNLCLIGMGAIILDGATVEDKAMVAAGATVTPGKTVPSGELWAGSPAKFMRKLTDKDMEYLEYSAQNYVNRSKEYFAAGLGQHILFEAE
ncbi:MAG: gamma carbonic anhydrase family protein [Alphaproteobacteria bacterium]|jgi:carbonic anhydrase/acetyltransferase-like protein (isoleucine patch superfamily)|nr:gamma carbonic anhydrase family protein [Alphaproteobacteria bacterium]MDP7223541.1 gamma carbonic anhydrase family protein [Alphaproteobacteria bacterium]